MISDTIYECCLVSQKCDDECLEGMYSISTSRESDENCSKNSMSATAKSFHWISNGRPNIGSVVLDLDYNEIQFS